MEARRAAQDADIGLTRFLTTTTPLGGRLKLRVDDFRVDEIGGLPPEAPQGRFVCAIVRLANRETNQFVGEASDRLKISRKRIHFSGTKDKRGVTTRAFTFEAEPDAVASLGRMPGVEIVRVFRTDRESALGDHSDNAFEIVVRDLAGDAAEVRSAMDASWKEAMEAGGFPNVFGPQRFGSVRATTHLVGERIVRGDFRGAVHAYLGEDPPGLTGPSVAAWKEALSRQDYGALLRLATSNQGFERALLHRLVERPDDPVDALRALPKNLQILFVYAYQSLLFNRVVCERLARGLGLARAHPGDLVAPLESGEVQEEWIPVTETNRARVQAELDRGRGVLTGPLPGTEAPLAAGEPGAVEAGVLSREGVTRSNWVVPENLEWSSKGTRRALTLRPQGFEARAEADDLVPGRTKASLRFVLPRGCYATSVLREFLKAPALADYG